MEQLIRELFERKSVRAFENKDIESDKRRIILEAAVQAPSAGNMTLYSIINVTDQELKETLVKTCDNQPFIAKAPMVLVFCADYQKWYDAFCIYSDEVRRPAEGDLLLACEDTLVAAQNAVVAAWSMGIGSCYIGDVLERYEIHQKLFDLPKYVLPIAMVVFGYPTKQQMDRPKPKRFAVEDIVSENKYKKVTGDEFISMLKKRQVKSGEEFDQWMNAFFKRKWNCDFSIEMSRSVHEMIKSWNK